MNVSVQVCVKESNSIEVDSDVSLEIPSGTVIAYSVLELEIKKDGQYGGRLCVCVCACVSSVNTNTTKSERRCEGYVLQRQHQMHKVGDTNVFVQQCEAELFLSLLCTCACVCAHDNMCVRARARIFSYLPAAEHLRRHRVRLMAVP